MSDIDVQDRVIPDLEARLEEAVGAFRENHQHPANLALHAVGYVALARGAIRLLQRRPGSAVLHTGVGLGLLYAGHAIEGTEPFTAMRALS